MKNNGLWKILFPVTALQRLGSGDLQLHYRIGQEQYTTGLNPNTVRVAGLSKTGFKSMSSPGLTFPSPSHGDTPLFRGDVTRLVSLGYPPPLQVEEQGPLSGFYLLAEDALDACLPLRVVKALREDVLQLG